MLCVYNPLPERRAKRLDIDLYYTGLKELVRVREQGGEAVGVEMDARGHIWLDVDVAAGGMSWVLIE